MKKTLLLLLLLSTSVFAQKKMVLIEAEKTIDIVGFHTMKVPDDLTAKVVAKYVFYMENDPVNYEAAMRKVKQIKMIQKDRYYVSNFKKGTLYLNSRLDSFPAIKTVVIIQELAKINGMQLRKDTKAHVTSANFNITKDNEETFRRQLTRDSPYKYVVEELIKQSPLKSKR